MPEFSQRIILKPPIYYLSTKNALQFKMQKKQEKEAEQKKGGSSVEMERKNWPKVTRNITRQEKKG